MKASVRLEHALLAVESEHTVHAMLELTAPQAPEGATRPPLHLALVIDRSGSRADFSEELLTAMAEAGGGRSRYAASPGDAAWAAFGRGAARSATGACPSRSGDA